MFGFKIFVRVQTFWRVPTVLPCNFCHPGTSNNANIHANNHVYELLLQIYFFGQSILAQILKGLDRNELWLFNWRGPKRPKLKTLGFDSV